MTAPALLARPVRPLALALAAGIALTGAALFAPMQADAVIVPGKSVAGVALGDSAAKVRAKLGKPEAGSTPFNLRYLRRHGVGVYLIAGKVVDLTVTGGREATAKRVRVGSSEAALKKAYPAARCRATATRATVECRLSGRHRGRASHSLFTVRSGKVAAITVAFG